MIVVRDAVLETVCGPSSNLPENRLPEIAFAGRSNAGKSSLINMIMNRKNLARTSAQPGKTQTVNYYRVDAFIREGDEKKDCPFYLVDLPGYGYARASKKEVERWGELIERYLNTSGQLCSVFLLMDIRRTPDDKDELMYRWINDAGIRPVLIATKADKLKKTAAKKQLSLMAKTLGLGSPGELIPVSTLDRTGLDRVYNEILKRRD